MLNDENLAVGESDRKEEFTSKLQDTELLAQIKLWEKEAESVYEALKRVWDQNLEYYLGNQTDRDKIVGRNSKATENRIWMAIETMIPIATARLPDIVVKAGEKNEQAILNAQDHQDVLSFHFERVQIQSLGERFIRDMLLKRYGVFKVRWDNNIDDVAVEVVDPKRIRIPKFGRSVQALKFLIEDLEMSYDQMVDFFGQKKADELIKQRPKDSEGKVRKATTSVKEVWTNEYLCWVAGEKVLKKQDNPYWKKDGNNFFDQPNKPYIIKSLFETDESLLGDTDYVQQSIPIQDNLNIRKRQIEDITNKVADPKLLIDSDAMSEEEAANITNEPGGILYGKDVLNKVKFIEPGSVPQYLFQDLEFTRAEFDNIWGIHATTRGEREGRETLGGRQMLREADLGRIDLVGRQLERALDEIAEWWSQLITLFYTDERAFTILGEDGQRFIENFSGKSVGKKVRPMVKPGSTLKEDEFSIAQKAIILWQNKAIGLRTLYKMLRLPDVQGAVDDYVETQSGRILQPKTPNTAGATMTSEMTPAVGQTAPQAANPMTQMNV